MTGPTRDDYDAQVQAALDERIRLANRSPLRKLADAASDFAAYHRWLIGLTVAAVALALVGSLVIIALACVFG